MAEVNKKKQPPKKVVEKKGTVEVIPTPIPETEKSDATNEEVANDIAPQIDPYLPLNEENSNPEPEPESESVLSGAAKISVVIPFLAAAAQGEELKYALRSMDRNFKEDFKVIIIGDRPEWLSDEAIHISHECMSKNPQVDVIDKIKTILISEQVSDKFVWTNDDIYFVTPVSLADIETLKIVGDLKDMPTSGTLYSENRVKTIELLESANLPTRNFATHLPVLLQKEKVIQLFEEFSALNDGGFLFSSVYFNRHFPDWKPILLDWINDNWSLRLITKNPDPDKFRKIVNRSKWLNNAESGYSEFLEKYLNKKFPEKSKFEI